MRAKTSGIYVREIDASVFVRGLIDFRRRVVNLVRCGGGRVTWETRRSFRDASSTTPPFTRSNVMTSLLVGKRELWMRRVPDTRIHNMFSPFRLKPPSSSFILLLCLCGVPLASRVPNRFLTLHYTFLYLPHKRPSAFSPAYPVDFPSILFQSSPRTYLFVRHVNFFSCHSGFFRRSKLPRLRVRFLFHEISSRYHTSIVLTFSLYDRRH